MVSIGEIIFRIGEHPLLKNVKKSDIVTHVKTVIELIGVPALYTEKTVKLLIKNYRAKLPDDFRNRISVRVIYQGQKRVLTHDMNDFKSGVPMINETKETDGNFEETMFTHYISNGYLYVDFQEGEVELAYRAYAQDENGWPMIPKNESLILAIENYIKARYFGILADMNANYERAYQRAEQQYTWYVQQAHNSMLQLDPVEAKALAERIFRMVPTVDSFYTNDKYSGQPEQMNKNIW